MDANAGPGLSRPGWEKVIGPLGVSYPHRDVDKDPNCVKFREFCKTNSLKVGQTWLAHKIRHKHTFYPNQEEHGSPKDIDHVLIDNGHSSCLEDVKVAPEVQTTQTTQGYCGFSGGSSSAIHTYQKGSSSSS